MAFESLADTLERVVMTSMVCVIDNVFSGSNIFFLYRLGGPVKTIFCIRSPSIVELCLRLTRNTRAAEKSTLFPGHSGTAHQFDVHSKRVT